MKDLRTGATLLKGTTKDGVYEWPPIPPESPPILALTGTTTSSSNWHHRLGHPAYPVLKFIVSKFNLDLSSSMSKDLVCHACHCNKSHKLPFSTSSLTSSQPLEIIYSDVWSSPVVSHDGYKYYVIFVDHLTKYVWFYPLKKKSDVKDTFIRFKAIVENFFKHKIVTLYSDNGREYVSLRDFLATSGISHLTTPPHTPEHNGYSERRHRHIVETGLTLLSHASLPLQFWSHAFAAAVYLINRMPTVTLNHTSPYEMIFGAAPNYSKLKIFGSLCYPWLRPYSSHKLSPRSSPCVFLGYSMSQSAYICYDPSTTRIYISRHVQFVESVFPYTSLAVNLPRPSPTTLDSWVPPVITLPGPITCQPVPPSTVSSPELLPYGGTSTSPRVDSPVLAPLPADSLSTAALDMHAASSLEVPSSATADGVDVSTGPACSSGHAAVPACPGNASPSVSVPILVSSQQSVSPSSAPQLPVRHSMTTRAKNNIHKPVQKLNLHTQLSPTADLEPTTVSQALKDPN